ncbi:MAG: hypothetical protein U1E36_07195 [Rickettsiales bacterium]
MHPALTAFGVAICLMAGARAQEAVPGYKYYDPNKLQSMRITVVPGFAVCDVTQNKRFIMQTNNYPTHVWFYPKDGKVRITCHSDGYNSTFSEGEITGYLPEKAGEPEIKLWMCPKKGPCVKPVP